MEYVMLQMHVLAYGRLMFKDKKKSFLHKCISNYGRQLFIRRMKKKKIGFSRKMESAHVRRAASETTPCNFLNWQTLRIHTEILMRNKL